MLLADLAASLPAPMTVIAAEPITGEQVLSELAREIENNKEFYATYARDAILDTIGEDDLFSYYNHYRPLLLGDLYQGIRMKRKSKSPIMPISSSRWRPTAKYYLAQDRKALPGVLTEADILPLYATYRDDLAEDLFTLLGEEIETTKEHMPTNVRSAIGEGSVKRRSSTSLGGRLKQIRTPMPSGLGMRFWRRSAMMTSSLTICSIGRHWWRTWRKRCLQLEPLLTGSKSWMICMPRLKPINRFMLPMSETPCLKR